MKGDKRRPTGEACMAGANSPAIRRCADHEAPCARSGPPVRTNLRISGGERPRRPLRGRQGGRMTSSQVDLLVQLRWAAEALDVFLSRAEGQPRRAAPLAEMLRALWPG